MISTTMLKVALVIKEAKLTRHFGPGSGKTCQSLALGQERKMERM